MHSFSVSNTKKLFFLIILLASILRIWGIWHGYPYSYYGDETHFVKRALSFGSFDFNPHWFHKPAFYMYILFFDYGLYFLIGKLLGFWATASEFAVSYIINPGPFYLIGRFTTVLFSLGSIWVVYKVGESHFKKGTGIIAALLLSLSYGHVATCQDVKADTPAMFFIIMSILFLLNYFEEKRFKDLVWTAAFAGMGTATKAYPIVMLVPIILTIIVVHGNTRAQFSELIKKILLSVGTIIVVFYTFYFLCSPYNFIDPLGRESTFSWLSSVPRRIASVFGMGNTIARPGDFLGQTMSLPEACVDYFRVVLATSGMGIPIGVMAILGFAYLIIKLNKKTFLFLLFPVVFISISIFMNPGYAESRHQLPIYPFLAITGGAFVVELAGTKGLRASVVYIMLIFCLSYPIYNIVDRAIYISQADTRNMAKTWIDENIPSGTKILADENGPPFLMSEEGIHEMLQKAKQADPKGQFTAHYDTYLQYQLLAAKDTVTYDIHAIRFPWWRESQVKEGIHELDSKYDQDMGNPLKPVGVESYDYYVKNGFKYAVVQSDSYKKFLSDNKVSINFPSFQSFYRDLFARASLEKEFTPNNGERPGPTVKIFKFMP